jgi:hypothetical protein
MRAIQRPIAAGLGAVVLAFAAGGCGEEGEAPATIVTGDPAATFAPLVRLHPRERSFPMSARRFLAKSGLEWSGGPCPLEIDVSASASSRAAAGDRIPPLDPTKLGTEPAYKVRPHVSNCIDLRPHTYSTTMRTRPFDTDDRPVGLQVDEGFSLDILSNAQPGRLRLGGDGTLAGVPAYYARDPSSIGGRTGLRLSYWLLYGRGKAPDPDQGDRLVGHEGDWERVDVLVRRERGRDRYTPVSIQHFSGGERRLVTPWNDTERAGASSTHPVVYAARATHTPGPRGDCIPSCTDWKTWRLLRDVREEAWFGYGGGWGAFEPTAAAAGPLGPSPFQLGPSP